MHPVAHECPVSRARRTRAQRLLATLLLVALGMQIGSGWALLSAPRSAAAPQPVVVDLSQAPVWRLRLLPGIGTRRAYAIVDDRLQNGPLRSFDDLERIPGFGPGIAASLRGCTSVRIVFGDGDAE